MATKLQPIIDRLALSFDEMYTYANRLGIELENIDARLDKVEKGESFVSLPQQGSFGTTGALKVSLESGPIDDYIRRSVTGGLASFFGSAISPVAPLLGLGALVLSGLADDVAEWGGAFATKSVISLGEKKYEIFDGLANKISEKIRENQTPLGTAAFIRLVGGPVWGSVLAGAFLGVKTIQDLQEDERRKNEKLNKELNILQNSEIEQTTLFSPPTTGSHKQTLINDTSWVPKGGVGMTENRTIIKPADGSLPVILKTPETKPVENTSQPIPNTVESPQSSIQQQTNQEYVNVGFGLVKRNDLPEDWKHPKDSEVVGYGTLLQIATEEVLWIGGESALGSLTGSPHVGIGVLTFETLRLMTEAHKQKQSGEGLLHDLSNLGDKYSQDFLASAGGALAETVLTVSPFFSAPVRAGKAYLNLIQGDPEVASPWLKERDKANTFGDALKSTGKDLLTGVGNVFVPSAGAVGMKQMDLFVEMMLKRMEKEDPFALNFEGDYHRGRTRQKLEDEFINASKAGRQSLYAWAKKQKKKEDNRKLFDLFKQLQEVPEELSGKEILKNRQSRIRQRGSNPFPSGIPGDGEIRRIIQSKPEIASNMDETRRVTKKIADEMNAAESQASKDFIETLNQENMVTILARMLDNRGFTSEAIDFLEKNKVLEDEMLKYAEEQLRWGKDMGDFNIFTPEFWEDVHNLGISDVDSFDGDDFLKNHFDFDRHVEPLGHWHRPVVAAALIKPKMRKLDPDWRFAGEPDPNDPSKINWDGTQEAFDAYIGPEATAFNRVLRGVEGIDSLGVTGKRQFWQWLKLHARYGINPLDAGSYRHFRGLHGYSGVSGDDISDWYARMPGAGDIVLETNFLSTSYDPKMAASQFGRFDRPFGTFFEVTPDDASQWLHGSYRESEAIYGAGSLFEVEDSFTRLVPSPVQYGLSVASGTGQLNLESLTPFSFVRLRQRLNRSLSPNWISAGSHSQVYRSLRDLPPEVKKYLERIYGSKTLKTVGGLGIGYGAYSVLGGGSVSAYAQEPHIISMDDNGVAVFSDGTVKDYSKLDTNLRLPRVPSFQERASQFLRTPIEEETSEIEETVAGMVEGQQKFIDPNRPWQYVDTVTGGRMGQFIEEDEEEQVQDERDPREAVRKILGKFMEVFEGGERERINKGVSAISDLSPGFLGGAYYELRKASGFLDDIEQTFPRDKPEDREFFDSSRDFLDRTEQAVGEAIKDLPWGKQIREEAALAEKAIKGLEASSDRFGRQVSEALAGTVLQTENWKERLKLIPGQLQDLILQTTVINPVRSLLQQFISAAANRILGGFIGSPPKIGLDIPKGTSADEYLGTLSGGQFGADDFDLEFKQVVNGADPSRARKYGDDIRDSLLGR